MATRNIHYCEFCGHEFTETKQMKEMPEDVLIKTPIVLPDPLYEKYEACNHCIAHIRDGAKEQNWGIFKKE